MNNYRSTAAIYPECIDSRRLFMQADYFLLTKEQADSFVCSFMEWCAGLWQNDFIISWHYYGRKVGFNKLLDAIREDESCVSSFVGAVASDQIHNQRAVNRFVRQIERYENEVYPSDASADYMNFFSLKKHSWSPATFPGRNSFPLSFVNRGERAFLLHPFLNWRVT